MEAEDRKEFEQRSPWTDNKFADPDAFHRGDFLSGASLGFSPGTGSSIFDLQFKPLTNRTPDIAARGDSSLPTITFLMTQRDKVAKEKQVEQTAGELANFIKGANKSLDIAIYSFNIKDKEAQQMIIDALNDRAENGVTVRLAYHQNEPRIGASAGESLPFLSEKSEASQREDDESTQNFLSQLDPRISASSNVHTAVNLPDSLSSDVSTEPIKGGGRLMHNKYIVRDAGTADASVWTGSTNWTDDAFGTQDNNIIQLKSKEVADVFAKNFQELWDNGDLTGTGADSHTTVKMGDSTVTIAFSPGDGDYIAGEIARRIAAADHNVHIASMDVSNSKIMKAIIKELGEGTNVDGVYDQSQMNVVIKAWEKNNSTENLAMWEQIKPHLIAKQGKGVREMMHNKVVQVDDKVVVTGSFNFTSNATKNAENIVIVENPTVAKQFGKYINDLVIAYGGESVAKKN